MENAEYDALKAAADWIRRKAVDMAYLAGSHGAHLGGSLSSVEIYAVLYGKALRFRKEEPDWPERDRFIAGKEHGRLSEYAAMAWAGILEETILDTYLEDGGKLTGHPRDLSLGLEYSSCSLGMALPVAAGMALAAKRMGKGHHVYTLMGDGELQEGSMWEAFLCAGHYRLDNLCAVIDRNRLSSDGETEKLMALGDIGAKLEAFGWRCVHADGHDVRSLALAFERFREEKGRPVAIVADTVKGKGLSFAENDPRWHNGVLTQELYERALRELAGGENNADKRAAHPGDGQNGTAQGILGDRTGGSVKDA